MKTPKVMNVLIDELIFDPENANKMSERDFAQLVKNIKQVGGMYQPVLVKETPEGFQMVDGEHRARATKEAGFDSVLAVIWDGTEAMRKALAISFNKLRGELDLTRVQHVVASLHEEGWTVNEIAMTGFDIGEIEHLLKVETDVDPDDVMAGAGHIDTSGADSGTKLRPLVIELTFATPAEMKAAKKALRKAAGKGRELGEGLLQLIGYEAKN